MEKKSTFNHPKDKRRFKRKIQFKPIVGDDWGEDGMAFELHCGDKFVTLIADKNEHFEMVRRSPELFNELLDTIETLENITKHYGSELSDRVHSMLLLRQNRIMELLNKI